MKLKQAIKKLDFHENERPYVEQCLRQCFERGFSLDDAVRYTKTTEHVSPDLDEEIALKRMSEISKRYEK